jgi:aspartate aminotransferase-like enzyme
VIDCDKEVGILEAVVKALEHKRPALEAGVKLWSASYFGEPSAKNAGTTTYKVNEAKADKALGKRKRTDDD